MKILMITEYVPYPPDNGIRVKIHNLVNCLSRIGELVCVYLSEKEQGGGIKTGLSTSIREYEVRTEREKNPVLRYLGHMVQICGLRIKGIKEIHEIIEREKPTVIWLEFGYICKLIPELRRHGLPIIYGSHNSQFSLDYERWKGGGGVIRKIKTAPVLPLLYINERVFMKKADRICCLSRSDMAYYMKIVPQEKVAYMPFVYDHLGVDNISPIQEGHPYVCLIGSLRSLQNYQAAVNALENLWPKILARHRDLYLYIIGEWPGSGSREYRKIKELTTGAERVVATGRVDNIIPYLKGALVNMVPLTMGSGVRTKIIESVVCGTAVVSTSIGGQGLPFVNGESILIADIDDDFVDKVVLLAEDAARRHLLADNAYRVFVNELSVDAGKRAVLEILAGLSVRDCLGLPG